MNAEEMLLFAYCTVHVKLNDRLQDKKHRTYPEYNRFFAATCILCNSLEKEIYNNEHIVTITKILKTFEEGI